MSTYTPQYTRPYENGYVDRPDESTPEYARFINARDDALLRIEAFLAALNIPSKLSELVNDEGFIKNTVSNLANYYLKTETYARTETYTQAEVQALIADAVSKVSGKLNISVVDALPTSDISTTTFYLVPKETAQEKNIYDEYINTDGTESGWELIGAVSTSADLSEYYKKTEVDTLLANKVNTSDLVASSFSGTKAIIGNQVSSGSGSALHNYSTEEKVVATWIDGRPVYEKTFIFTVPSSTQFVLIPNTSIENLDEVIKRDFTVDKTFLYEFCPWDSSNTIMLQSIVKDGIMLYIGGTSWAGKSAKAVLQYTKTTDTATA